MSGGRERRAAAGRPLPSSLFDAQAALEHLLSRLRASAGATRVSVWVHEPSTDTAVPFRSVIVESSRHSEHSLQLRTPLPLSDSPFLATVVRKQQPLVARADGRRAVSRS